MKKSCSIKGKALGGYLNKILLSWIEVDVMPRSWEDEKDPKLKSKIDEKLFRGEKKVYIAEESGADSASSSSEFNANKDDDDFRDYHTRIVRNSGMLIICWRQY
jgi:hypothetical protein